MHRERERTREPEQEQRSERACTRELGQTWEGSGAPCKLGIVCIKTSVTTCPGFTGHGFEPLGRSVSRWLWHRWTLAVAARSVYTVHVIWRTLGFDLLTCSYLVGVKGTGKQGGTLPTHIPPCSAQPRSFLTCLEGSFFLFKFSPPGNPQHYIAERQGHDMLCLHKLSLLVSPFLWKKPVFDSPEAHHFKDCLGAWKG